MLDYEVPGIAEAIRAFGREKVPTAALSRGPRRGGGRTLIVNLPGSTGGVKDGLAVLALLLVHAVDQIPAATPATTAADPAARGCELNSPSWPVELADGDIVTAADKAARPAGLARGQPAQPGLAAGPGRRRSRRPRPAGRWRTGRPTARWSAICGRRANAGRMLPFVIEYQGRLVGQLTVAGITWGSMCSGHVGYWVDEAVAGRGVMPTAGGARRRPLLPDGRTAPHRGLHSPRERAQPPGRGETRIPRRGAASPLSPHRRGLARPSRLRAHRGGGAGGLLAAGSGPSPAGAPDTSAPMNKCSKMIDHWVIADRRARCVNSRLGGLLIASITKKARNISQIVRHTGPIGRWPRKPLYGVRREQQRPHLRSHCRGLGRLLGADVAP